MKEIGIYIHIPFCKQKCYYCDFISYANMENYVKEYIKALIKEIKYNADKIKDEVTTIYIGGGTPSFIDAKYIKQILSTLKESYKISKEAEITIEINPGTINKEKLKSYKDNGINRISIGLQSTKNNLLKLIGRIHTYEQFLECYNLARQIGFENINVDLMLGLPNQEITDLEESLNDVIKLNPEHISLYSLILEENTKLKEMVDKKEIILPNDDIERKMYWKTKHILEQSGYVHYEISNFAREGFESKHNTNCWKQKEYLGFGAAAHSYYKGKRFCNINNLEKYCKNINEGQIDKNVVFLEEQSKEDMKKEYMLLELRMIEGVNIQEFKNKFVENPIYLFHNELDKLAKEELIEVDLNNIKLTNKGLDFANMVWEEFV